MKKSKFTVEIEQELIRLAPKKFSGKFKPEDYIKGNGMQFSELQFLNLTMPAVRNQLKLVKGENLFKDMQNLWFESRIFDAKILAVYWLDKQPAEFLVKNSTDVLSWALEIDNWAHSDALCSIFARLYEAAPEKVLPVYLKWNRHKNPWLRRCSMVGTFYYSRMRKNPISFSLAKKLVTPHFKAPEYYVQKGVGWTIREMYNVYPDATIAYIQQNIRHLTPIAWVAASEKLDAKIKAPLLEKRKKFRQKN